MAEPTWDDFPVVGQAPATMPNPQVPVQQQGPVYGPAPARPSPPSGYQWGPNGELIPVRGGPADPNRPATASESKPTESERTAAFLATRVATASQQLAQIDNEEARSPSLGVEAVRGVFGDTAANYLTGSDRQRIEAAQLDFLDAALTLGTGAAYTREQIEGYRKAYFPQLGDTPATIADKKDRLRAMLESAKVKAGNAAPDIDRAMAAIFPQQEGGGSDENPFAGIIGQDGQPLGPEGGYGQDPETGEWGMYSRTTDESANTPPPQQGGSGLMDATQNAIAGAVQGAGGALYDFPMDVAGGVEKGITYALTEGGGALADAVGAEGVADWWREAGGKRMEDLNNPNALANQRVTDVVERVSPTPEGMGGARFAAQLIGGAAVPFGPKAAPKVSAPVNPVARSAARETIEAGAENQVRVMTSDVRPPSTFLGKAARTAGERIPYAGTGGPRAAQQQERVDAIKRVAQEFGYDEAVPYLDDIAADLASTRGAAISNLTKAKDSVIDNIQGAVQAPKALAEIDRQIAKLKGINEEAFAPVIAKLENFKGALSSGKSLREVESNRKLLGDLFSDPNLASIRGEGQRAINAIYGPLRDDMGAFIQRFGGDEAFNKWKGANARLADLAGELDSAVFKSVLSKAETTPEDVARLLFSKKPSDVRRLVSNLSPEGLRKARAGIIHLAIEKAGGIDNISPDRFANAIAQNSKAAGIIFSGDDLARLNGLQRVLQATKQASVAGAAPPTGVQSTPIVGGYAAGSLFGAAAVPWLGGIGGLARLYESPATRNLLVGLSRTKPGSKAEGAILDRIAAAAAAQAEIQGGNVGRAANENSLVAPLAAQEDDPRQAN